MSVRSESLLALVLPAIAISWVITDAAMGLVAADRAAAAATVHIVSANQTSIAVETKPSRATVTICSRDGTVAAGIVQTGGSHATLQRLCQAGRKFTTKLPTN